MAGVNKNFVVKNGLEVNTDLIFADVDQRLVGINTDNMKYMLHVNGGIGVTNLYSSGIGTFNAIHLAGDVVAGSAGAGDTGQYLVRTGTGVTWQNLPSTRSSQTFTASESQTVFFFSYTVDFLDVFVNGVKLAPSEYTAEDTASITLNTPCFGGETVEFVTYSSVNPGYGYTGIYGISLFEEGVPVGTSGQVVALNFVGAAVTSTATGIAATVYVTENWTKNTQGVYSLDLVGIGTTDPGNSNLAVVNSTAQAALTVGQNVDGSGTDHFGIYYDNILGTAGIGGTATLFTSNGDIRINVNDQISNIIFGNGVGDLVVIDSLGNTMVGVDTSTGVILTSPNGTRYQLFVENNGTLKTVAV